LQREICNCKPKFSLLWPSRLRGLQRQTSKPHWPLYWWAAR